MRTSRLAWLCTAIGGPLMFAGCASSDPCRNMTNCRVDAQAVIDAQWQPSLYLTAYAPPAQRPHVGLMRHRGQTPSKAWRITPEGEVEPVSDEQVTRLPVKPASTSEDKLRRILPQRLREPPMCHRLAKADGKCVVEEGVLLRSVRLLRDSHGAFLIWAEQQRKTCGRRFRDVDPFASCRNAPPDQGCDPAPPDEPPCKTREKLSNTTLHIARVESAEPPQIRECWSARIDDIALRTVDFSLSDGHFHVATAHRDDREQFVRYFRFDAAAAGCLD